MANRHERRRRAAVFQPVMVPVDAIAGRGRCAWRDCGQSFAGDLPDGWCWLISHTSKQFELDLTPLIDSSEFLDIALCAQHRKELHAHLVVMPDPRLFGKPSE